MKVTELYGCSSSFSNPYKVIAANGTNAPDAATSLVAVASSKTSVVLNWTNKPNPAYNETGFEVYNATAPGGQYTLRGITGADIATYTDVNLVPNTKYYYIIRAVNNNGAAPVSNEANATTLVDNTAPTAPGNVRVSGTSRTSATLAWTASTDDVGVDKYDIYINGFRSYTAAGNQTTFTVTGLTYQQIYTFVVKARDITGNVSPASNQVSAAALNSGLTYKYYTGAWSNLPDFNALTPVKTGTSANVDLAVADDDDNFAIMWTGYIRIPVSGNYTFMTNSDDGSKLYINTPYTVGATALVNNDGLHGGTFKEGTINLAAGVYPITMTFFEAGGGQTMEVWWKNTASGVTSQQKIPDAYFSDLPLTMPVPAAPTNIKATAISYNVINLAWNDNSNNETGFEIYRSTSLNDPFNIIATTTANKNTYRDSLLTPQTTYYYKVKAINNNGNSGFSMADGSGLQYDYYEAATFNKLPDFNSLTPVKSGNTTTVNVDMRNRDANFAIKFSGPINIPTSGSYTFYTASDDASSLYIDGFDTGHRIVNNDYQQGTTERSGTKTLTAGKHIIYVTYQQGTGGFALTASYKGPSLTKRLIPASAFMNIDMSATTQALPSTPAAPTNLTLGALSGSKVQLEWKDNSANESGFEIWRSVANNSNYILQTTTASSDSAYAEFTDTALLANVTYFYKVRAKNVGGTSVYSNEASVVTLNTPPVLQPLGDKSMRFGTQLVVPVNATDADGETLALTATNVPGFGAFVDNGNGTGSFTFNPSVGNQGTYTGIQVAAADQHGGLVYKTFSLVVNDNYPPVLSPVSNVSLTANTSTQVNVTASDNNSTDVINWNSTGLPSFATLTPNGNSAQIQVAPGYSDAGTYPVTLTVDDGKGGVDTKTFTITVAYVNPNFTLSVNWTDGAYKGAAPWNNTNKRPALGDVYGNLVDQNNVNTGIAIQVMTPWQQVNSGVNSNNQGYSTGNNSGIYPDNVLLSNVWTQNVKQTFKLTGLKPKYKYSFTFFGSRNGISDDRIASYTINGSSVTLNAKNNANQTATLSNMVADSTGAISVDLAPAAGQIYAYINAMVVTASYDDSTAPASPINVNARTIPTGARLSWTDRAYNENAYEVYRATVRSGPYALLNPGANNANDTAYTDVNVIASGTYYYAVRSINGYGASPYSDTVTLTMANRNPVFTAIPDVSIKTDDTQTITLNASDDAGDVLTLSATGLPSFAALHDNGNGTGTLTLTPVTANIGRYDVTLKAADDKGGISTQTINIAVRDKSITATYVNFNQVMPVSAPWNNFNSLPLANANISNMKDETGTATGANITLIDTWSGANTVGVVTGNNSGIYPDSVMQTFYYDQTGGAKRIRITNLATTRKYNLVFFGSRASVSDNRISIYGAGGQTVILNAASNSTNTVQINGLSPDGSGTIEFTVQQPAGSFSSYLNSLVIQSYVDDGTPLAPDNLSAAGQSKSSIRLTWADKSSNETGFEVWRSTSKTSGYALVTTTAANATSYTDNGLAQGTLYYYQVRATAGTPKSAYSNIAAGSTISYGAYINIDVTTPAPAPWNNTNSLPYQGQTLTNITDDNGNPTSLTMTIDQNFTGTNPAGTQTGNNSGIYPDVVLAESYYVEPGDTAIVRFSGMNQAMTYSFNFLGSRVSGGVRMGAYTMNGKTVTLDANNNTTNTVQIDGIVPDKNGEAILKIYVYANYGYLNALVIKAFPSDTSGMSSLSDPNDLQRIGGGSVGAKAPATTAPAVLVNNNDKTGQPDITITNTYPNPFSTVIYLATEVKTKSEKMAVTLIDMSGRIVFGKDLGDVGPGTQVFRLDIGSRPMPPGIYLLRVTSGNVPVKTIKLIKKQ